MRPSATVLLSLVALVTLGSCEAVQPKPLCRARPSKYAARYTLRSTPTDACKGTIITGEILHLGTYRPKPGDPGTPAIAIEPAVVADAVSEAERADVEVEGESEYSIGPFATTNPGDDNVCVAKELAETDVMVPALPADTSKEHSHPARPARSYKYSWSNVKMLVTPLSNALHFGGNLARTEGDCKANYRVSAVYPVVHCGDASARIRRAASPPSWTTSVSRRR